MSAAAAYLTMSAAMQAAYGGGLGVSAAAATSAAAAVHSQAQRMPITASTSPDQSTTQVWLHMPFDHWAQSYSLSWLSLVHGTVDTWCMAAVQQYECAVSMHTQAHNVPARASTSQSVTQILVDERPTVNIHLRVC